MKRTAIVLCTLTLGGAAGVARAQAPLPAAPPAIEAVDEKPLQEPAPSNAPEPAPTLERFKEALSPHGRWVRTPEYGEVWIPAVASGWRPYAHGRWVYSDAGWTFVSSDSWGWAPFHYGRWLYYPAHGWAWIPGYRWAPAWVSWRYGGGYVAWAPLGPEGVAVSYYGTPSLWMAVSGPAFYRPLVHHAFVPTARIRSVFGVTYFTGIQRRGFYHSPPVTYVSRVVGAPIARVAVRDVAPRWVARGAYRPHALVQRAFRSAPVVARPVGRPMAPALRPQPRVMHRPSAWTRPAPALRGSVYPVPRGAHTAPNRAAVWSAPRAAPHRPVYGAPRAVQPNRPTWVSPPARTAPQGRSFNNRRV